MVREKKTKSTGRIPKQIDLNNIWRKALSSINLPATHEPLMLFCDDDNTLDGFNTCALA